MNRIEKATTNYWRVSSCVNNGKGSMTVQQALTVLRECQEIIGPHREIARVVHELKFDIIEGNTKWRQPKNPDAEQGKGKKSSNLIPLMRE